MLKVFSINLGILALGVIFAELLFGNWSGKDPLTLLNIPRNGTWQYAVDYPNVKDHERNVFYTRDEFGLRGAYGNTEEIDLLTVGGSTTEQLLITDGKTWQDVLQKQFRAAGIKIGIANAGLSGHTTYGHVKEFQYWYPMVPSLRPCHVWVYVGINDMFYDDRYDRVDLFYTVDDRGLKEIIKNRSALYALYWKSLGVYLARKFDLAHTWLDYANAS